MLRPRTALRRSWHSLGCYPARPISCRSPAPAIATGSRKTPPHPRSRSRPIPKTRSSRCSRRVLQAACATQDTTSCASGFERYFSIWQLRGLFGRSGLQSAGYMLRAIASPRVCDPAHRSKAARIPCNVRGSRRSRDQSGLPMNLVIAFMLALAAISGAISPEGRASNLLTGDSPAGLVQAALTGPSSAGPEPDAGRDRTVADDQPGPVAV